MASGDASAFSSPVLASEPDMPQEATVNDEDSAYAVRRREFLNLQRKLKMVGAEQVIDIPEIVVIGSQSAGKSSLIETISGINVPRDPGTCTRCPMECSIAHTDGPWSCEITIRFYTDAHGIALPGGAASFRFGPIISDRDDVELAIRRAQTAILNPYLSTEHFLNMAREDLDSYRPKTEAIQMPVTSAAWEPASRPDTPRSGVTVPTSPMPAFDLVQEPSFSFARPISPGSEIVFPRIGEKSPSTLNIAAAIPGAPSSLKFSRNAVCIKIKDPQATDLDFVDLPGLIQNEEDSVIRMVTDLVHSYIKRPKSIILITVPMSDDIYNQRAIKIAQDHDPSRDRTIVVLTKPDLLLAGDNAQGTWRRELEARVNMTKNRYYCVLQRRDQHRESGMTREQALAREKQFFEETEPWSSSTARTRLGTPSLIRDLSALLIANIRKALPSMRQQVEQKLRICANKSESLPMHVAGDPMTEVHMLVSRFCRELGRMTTGHATARKQMIQQNRKTYETLKTRIRHTVPNFYPATDANFVIPSFGSHGYEEDLDNRSSPIYLQDVRTVIKSETTWELPHNIPYPAKTFFIDQFVASWEEPILSCFETVFFQLKNYLDLLISELFSPLPALESFIRDTSLVLLSRYREEATDAIKRVLESEKWPFFTLNTHYLDTVRAAYLLRYKTGYRDQLTVRASGTVSAVTQQNTPVHDMRFGRQSPDPEEQLMAALQRVNPCYASLSYKELVAALEPLKDYHEEIEVMADSRAYFQVAYKRIIDTIPLTIEQRLNRATADAMEQHIIQELRPSASDAKERFEALVAESPTVIARRKALQARKEQLERIEAELETVES